MLSACSLSLAAPRVLSAHQVALAADARHEGGRLLALCDGRVQAVERAEGEATIHPSTLLHGVSRMRAGVRYSLIIFWAERA